MHSLRHSFASMLIMNGAPVTEVRDLMGHSNATTILDIYSHWFRSVETNTVANRALDLLGRIRPRDRPHVEEWWTQASQWPSFRRGLHDLISETEFAEMRTHGPQIRDQVAARLAGLQCDDAATNQTN